MAICVSSPSRPNSLAVRGAPGQRRIRLGMLAHPGDRLARTVAVFYDHGLELVAHLDDTGDVRSTIDNRRVAATRLRLDAPASAFFFNPESGLRIDLLFDLPIAAATLAERATRTRIRSHLFTLASEPDLLRLKRIANASRSAPGDAEDIVFLEARQKSGSDSG
jgi:hypothetical protein